MQFCKNLKRAICDGFVYCADTKHAFSNESDRVTICFYIRESHFSLNQKQIAFVHKVITFVEQNGYMESVTDLRKPPFDKPISFLRLFNAQKQAQLIAAINAVKDNAVNVIA